MTARRLSLALLIIIPVTLVLIVNLAQADLQQHPLLARVLAPDAGFINYQGVLTDAGGSPVPDGSHAVSFSLYDVETGGTPLWAENHTVTTQNGLFSVYLGSVTPLNPDQLDGRDLWLGIRVASDPEMRPRIPITSVFYARSFIPGAVVRGNIPIESVLSIINTGSRGIALRLESPSSGIALEAEGDIETMTNITAERSISAMGSMSAGGNLEVAGTSEFGGNASFARNVDIGGRMSASSCGCPSLFTQGDVTVEGTTTVVLPTASFGQRRTYGVTGTEVWLVDQGQGQLKQGQAVIALDPVFTEMVTIDEDHPMLVQITLTGAAQGVYVAEKTPTHFVVRELGNGTSDATFDWQVTAHRKGYANARLSQLPASDASTTE